MNHMILHDLYYIIEYYMILYDTIEYYKNYRIYMIYIILYDTI